MSAIVQIQGLNKQYGQLHALHDLTLDIEQGSVFGFIGPNGAGKTTTMRLLTTLLQPTSGEAWIAGSSVITDPRGVRRAIGYMPDFFGVYEDMKVWEYLDFFAACYNLPETSRSGMIGDLLELVDLSHKRDTFVEELSRGMKQRLCLARTLAHDPSVLILDEPASGLDPRARIEMRELLRELQRMGKTIFFSSHILSEVADICTSIGIIEAGRLIASGNVAAMQRLLREHRLILVKVLGDPAAYTAALQDYPGVDGLAEKGSNLTEATPASALESPPGPNDNLAGKGNTLRVNFRGDDDALRGYLAYLVANGVPVVSFSEELGDLEEVFLQVTQGIIN
jgi:ABC-2 type transport system ATP-binding protein